MGSVRVSSSDINTAVTWWHLFGHHGEEGAALGLEGPVDVVHREATWGAFKYVGVEPLRAPSPHPHTQAVPHVGGSNCLLRGTPDPSQGTQGRRAVAGPQEYPRGHGSKWAEQVMVRPEG